MRLSINLCIAGIIMCGLTAACSERKSPVGAESSGIMAYLAQAGSASGNEGGGVYTAFGKTTCAPGWKAAYTGGVYSHGVANGGAGAVFCVEGSDTFQTESGAGHPTAAPLRLNGGGFILECAVCVR